MKTKSIVILVVQSILIVLALLYAIVQSSIATEKEKQAIIAHEYAIKTSQEATEYMKKVGKLEEVLKNCHKK